MRTKNPVSEKGFQAQVLDLARLCGWLCYHTHDSRKSAAGFPDLVLVRPPAVLFVELKTDNGRTSPAQRAWLDALWACPGVGTRLWRPGDWPEIVAMLSRSNQRTRR